MRHTQIRASKERLEQKVVFLSVFNGMITKNILNTGVVDKLVRDDSHKAVLLVPCDKYDFFVTHYSSDRICVEPVDSDSFINSRMETFMHRISMLLIDTHYLNYKRRELLSSDHSVFSHLKHKLRESFVKVFADKKIILWLFRALDSAVSKDLIFDRLFAKYKPRLVFSTDLFDQTNNSLLRAARHRGIPTVGMVRSWDNCSSKGALRIVPDTILTNNTVLKNELITTHRVDEKKINVVGLPQFDHFFTKNSTERGVFFKENGLDPSKRVVLFAPAGTILSKTDSEICNILTDAYNTNMLPKDVQFFVRNHPHHPADFSGLKPQGNLVLQNPGVVLDKKNHKKTEFSRSDSDFLRNILSYTDVLIWIATSLCLDALVYDVPQVVINFDGYKNKDYYHSVRRYHDEDHMKKMFALRPFRVANNKDELINFVNMYLSNRNVDSAERELARKQQLYRLDGKASEGITEILIEKMN